MRDSQTLNLLSKILDQVVLSIQVAIYIYIYILWPSVSGKVSWPNEEATGALGKFCCHLIARGLEIYASLAVVYYQEHKTVR